MEARRFRPPYDGSIKSMVFDSVSKIRRPPLPADRNRLYIRVLGEGGICYDTEQDLSSLAVSEIINIIIDGIV